MLDSQSDGIGPRRYNGCPRRPGGLSVCRTFFAVSVLVFGPRGKCSFTRLARVFKSSQSKLQNLLYLTIFLFFFILLSSNIFSYFSRWVGWS